MNIVPVESNPVVLLTVTVVAESVKAPSKFVVVISSLYPFLFNNLLE